MLGPFSPISPASPVLQDITNDPQQLNTSRNSNNENESPVKPTLTQFRPIAPKIAPQQAFMVSNGPREQRAIINLKTKPVTVRKQIGRRENTDPVQRAKPKHHDAPRTEAEQARMTRRNTRERNRVKDKNDAFDALRKAVSNEPTENGATPKKPISKLQALQLAKDRIAELQNILAQPVGNASTQETPQTTRADSSNLEQAANTTSLTHQLSELQSSLSLEDCQAIEDAVRSLTALNAAQEDKKNESLYSTIDRVKV